MTMKKPLDPRFRSMWHVGFHLEVIQITKSFSSAQRPNNLPMSAVSFMCCMYLLSFLDQILYWGVTKAFGIHFTGIHLTPPSKRSCVSMWSYASFVCSSLEGCVLLEVPTVVEHEYVRLGLEGLKSMLLSTCSKRGGGGSKPLATPLINVQN